MNNAFIQTFLIRSKLWSRANRFFPLVQTSDSILIYSKLITCAFLSPRCSENVYMTKKINCIRLPSFYSFHPRSTEIWQHEDMILYFIQLCTHRNVQYKSRASTCYFKTHQKIKKYQLTRQQNWNNTLWKYVSIILRFLENKSSRHEV